MQNSLPPLITGRYHDITEALSQQLADLAGESPSRFPLNSGVLVPSRSAASSITRALLGRRPDGFAGLALRTLETFGRDVVNEHGSYPRVASDQERRIAMRKAAESIEDPLLRTPDIESLLDRSYRDLRDSGSTLNDFESGLGKAQARDRMRLLLRVWRTYEVNLGRLRVIDPADLLALAASRIESDPNLAPQVLFGFYDITGMQRLLVSSLLRAGKISAVYFPIAMSGGQLPPRSSFAAPLATLLQTYSAETVDLRPASVTCSRVRTFSTTQVQMREVCRGIRSLLDQGLPADEIGVVCRSLEPLESATFGRLAEEFEFRVTDRNGRSIRSQRIGRAVLRLLRIHEENYPRSAVIELLRDGFRASLQSRQVDRLDLLTRKYSIAGGTTEFLDSMIRGVEGRDERAATDLRRYQMVVGEIQQLVEAFGEPLRGRQWQQTLLRALDRFSAETEQDLVAMEAIDGIGAVLAACDQLDTRFAAYEVADLIETAPPISSRSTPGEIWFGDVMSMRGRSFRHLFFIAANEDRLPQRRNPDPLLPDHERARLKIPLIGDGRNEEELLFQLAADSALDTLTITLGLSDGYGKHLRPSAFLVRMPSSEPALGDAEPLSGREKLTRELREGLWTSTSKSLQRKFRRAQRIRRRGEFDGYLTDEAPVVEEIKRRLLSTSPTYLEDFGECPQKFLFRRLLHADELEDPEHEPQINHLDKGRIDHRILERFYRENHDRIQKLLSSNSAVLPPDLKESLSRIVEEEFQAFDLESPPFNPTIRRLERSLTSANLERFIGADLVELIESGFRPAQYEYSFGTRRNGVASQSDSIPLQVAGLKMSLKGTIDRVDRAGIAESPGERMRVVDYKSGKAQRHTSLTKKLEEGHRLQLALYALAAEEIFKLEPDRISGVIKPLGLSGKQKLERFSFELGEQKESLLRNLELFVGSMTRGVFPAFPSEESCRYCPMNHSCRAKYDPEEVRPLRAAGSLLELLQSLT